MAPEINLIDPEYFAEHGHPWDQYEWLRANAPVFWHDEPNGPGFWAITKYEDVRAISQNPELFSVAETGVIVGENDPNMFFGKDHMIFTLAGPQHERYRMLVARGLAPEDAALLRPRIQEIAREIVEAAMRKGSGDFVSEIALRLPSGLIAELMGIPREDSDHLYTLPPTRHTNDDPPASIESTIAAMQEILMYGQSMADLKRKTPSDDLATTWANDDLNGERLTDDEIIWIFFFLLQEEGARVLMAYGLQLLFDHPDQRDKLMSDIDGYLATAIEEMLRFSTPVPFFKRTVMEDTTIRGQQMKSGDRVVLFYGSANRDEEVFDNPNTFDITRDPNPHLTFGFGAHECLGKHLARVELAVMFRELLTLAPSIMPDGDVERMKTNLVAGIHRMPVSY
jgi:cytochrome P450